MQMQGVEASGTEEESVHPQTPCPEAARDLTGEVTKRVGRSQWQGGGGGGDVRGASTQGVKRSHKGNKTRKRKAKFMPFSNNDRKAPEQGLKQRLQCLNPCREADDMLMEVKALQEVLLSYNLRLQLQLNSCSSYCYRAAAECESLKGQDSCFNQHASSAAKMVLLHRGRQPSKQARLSKAEQAKHETTRHHLTLLWC